MSKAPQRNSISAGEVRNCRASMANKLDIGEIIAGSSVVTVTVTHGTSDLVVSSVGVSSEPMVVNGSSNSAGQVVTFVATCAVPAKYGLLVTAQTNMGQTLNMLCPLLVEASS